MKNRHIKSKCMTAFSPLADSLDGLFCFLSTELTYFSSCLSVEGLRVSKSISISSGLLSFSAGSLAWMMYTTRPSFSPGIDTVSIKTTRRNHQSLLRITRVHSSTQTLILTEYLNNKRWRLISEYYIRLDCVLCPVPKLVTLLNTNS